MKRNPDKWCKCGKAKSVCKPWPVCDCTRSKHPCSSACDRCLDLDGRNGTESRIIALMRISHGAVDSYNIADELGITQRSVLRGLQTLRRRGRVVRRSFTTGELSARYIRSEFMLTSHGAAS